MYIMQTVIRWTQSGVYNADSNTKDTYVDTHTSISAFMFSVNWLNIYGSEKFFKKVAEKDGKTFL